MGCKQDLEKAELLYKQSSDNGSVTGKFLFKNGKDKRGTGVMNTQGKNNNILIIMNTIMTSYINRAYELCNEK